MDEFKMPGLGAINYRRGDDVDRLLVNICAELVRKKMNLGGLLQISTGERGGNCATTMHVVDLRSEQSFDIWEARGACAQGCRLDESGLAEAEPILAAAIEARVDLLIINRFGRAESLGRGLRSSFDKALRHGVRVLTAVREPYDTAWREFHGGLGAELLGDVAEVVNWATASRSIDINGGRPVCM